jgi:hypothetical protein
MSTLPWIKNWLMLGGRFGAMLNVAEHYDGSLLVPVFSPEMIDIYGRPDIGFLISYPVRLALGLSF